MPITIMGRKSIRVPDVLLTLRKTEEFEF